MATARAFLFDIDGTLLNLGGIGKRSLTHAIEQVLGVPDALAQLHLDGMTDRGIVREALKLAGRDVAEADFEAVLNHYLLRLEASLPGPSYVVLPGVGEVLARLDQPGVALGLGTGNLEKGAHLKLQHSGLLKHFRFGGYGSDAEPRADVLAAGAARARALLPDLAPHEIWVVGDTPKDIAAARAIGAKVLAVATGRYSVEELRAHQPDAAVPTLLHAEVVVHLG